MSLVNEFSRGHGSLPVQPQLTKQLVQQKMSTVVPRATPAAALLDEARYGPRDGLWVDRQGLSRAPHTATRREIRLSTGTYTAPYGNVFLSDSGMKNNHAPDLETAPKRFF